MELLFKIYLAPTINTVVTSYVENGLFYRKLIIIFTIVAREVLLFV